MNTFLLFVVLISCTVCVALRCYSCNGATSSSCNDPFSSGGSGVTVANSNSYTSCKKTGAAGVISRDGESSCTAVGWTSGTGTLCCTTDLCNAAQKVYHGWSMLLFVCLVLGVFGRQLF